MAEAAATPTVPAGASTASDGQTGQTLNEASSSTTPAAAPAPSRMPTTLEYKKQQAAVRNLILKRIEIEKRLAALEDTIANKEQIYLDATPNGNIIIGYDHYMKSAGGAAAQRRKTGLGEQNKVFTKSSVSYRPNAADATPGSTPAASHAPTPLSTTFRDGPGASGSNLATPTSATAPSGKGGYKKRKYDEESDDESQAGGTKRRTNFGAVRR